MVENVKGIKISGKKFITPCSFDFFLEKESRVAVLFGRNGSGKSTLAEAFKLSSLECGDSSLSAALELLDGSECPLGAIGDGLYDKLLAVFDEKYVDRTIRLRQAEEGLGTIVLFADMGDVDEKIKAENVKLDVKTNEINTANIELAKYEDGTQVISPSYHWNRLVESLKRTWAEDDRKARGNTIKSKVSETVALEIAELQCQTPKQDVDKEIAKIAKDIDSVEKVGDVGSVPPLTLIDAGEFNESEFIALLNRTVESPVLNEREKRILALIQKGTGLIDEVKESFSNEETAYCPFCFRDINSVEKDELINSVEKVLGREVEDYKKSISGIVFPNFEFNGEAYDLIDHVLVEEIKSAIQECCSIVELYKKDGTSKRDNVFQKTVFETRNLSNMMASVNKKITLLEQKRASLLTAAHEKIKLQNCLIRLYKEKANHLIAPDYKMYKQQDAERKNKVDARKKLEEEKANIERNIGTLEAKKAGTEIAVEYINRALSYIFVSDKRFVVEPSNGSYILKSNGFNILPRDVSTGERNILALAYFFVDMMAGCEVKEFFTKERLVVVDDPVSSYDHENKIGVYSFLMRMFEKILKGNENSKIVMLTHDMHTVLNMSRALGTLSKKVLGSKKAIKFFELTSKGTLDILNVENRNEYSCLLWDVYKFAKNPSDATNAVTIGNEMRRVLEAYSTFLYRMNFLDLFRSEVAEGKLKGMSAYFSARMDRMILHGESHMEDRAAILTVDGDPLEVFTDSEKQQTAKDVLCLLHVLDAEHVRQHFVHGSYTDAVTDIQHWLEDIKHTLKPTKVHGGGEA